MDYKSRASGETEETLRQSATNHGYSGLPDEQLINETLLYLQGKFLMTLSDIEVIAWKKDLSKIPVWKISRIDEFPGPRMSEIWKFFDTLQPKIEAYVALPDKKPTDRQKEGTLYVLAHCRRMGEQLCHYDRLKLDYEFSAEMKERFNHKYIPILDP